MKLAAFINAHVEEIVEEFVAFASTLESAALGNSVTELRDHARGILLKIAADLFLRETPRQLHDKSVGERAPEASRRVRHRRTGRRGSLAASRSRN